jgi:hypothetical protein
MDKLNSKLFREYEERFGMTFSLFSVHTRNVDKVNHLMEESLRSGKPFYDRYFAPTAKNAAI